MKHSLWSRVSAHGGHTLDEDQITRLFRYRQWLSAEAMTAGGIGPGEGERLDDRHIADSLLFATPLRPHHQEIWDLGSGVGLPGIPLAVLLPQHHFTLIDHAGRRVDLMKRAVRILDLSNVVIVKGDISRLHGDTDAIVTRASLPAEKTKKVAQKHLRSGGIAIQGGSWVEKPVEPGWETLQLPAGILDQIVWLLIIRRQ